MTNASLSFRPVTVHLRPCGEPAGTDLLAGRHRAARRRKLHAPLHQGRSRLSLDTGRVASWLVIWLAWNLQLRKLSNKSHYLCRTVSWHHDMTCLLEVLRFHFLPDSESGFVIARRLKIWLGIRILARNHNTYFLLDQNLDRGSPKGWKSDSKSGSRAGVITPLSITMFWESIKVLLPSPVEVRPRLWLRATLPSVLHLQGSREGLTSSMVAAAISAIFWWPKPNAQYDDGESKIFRQSSNPVCGLSKSQASFMWAKKHSA